MVARLAHGRTGDRDTAAMTVTRTTLSYSLVTNATHSVSPAAAVLATVLLLCWPAVVLLLADRGVERLLGSLLLSASVVIDTAIVNADTSVYFNPAYPAVLASQQPLLYASSALLTAFATLVICVIVSGVSAISLALLQWRRIVAARRALVNAVKLTRATADRLTGLIDTMTQQLGLVTALANEATYQLDCINTLRPSAS